MSKLLAQNCCADTFTAEPWREKRQARNSSRAGLKLALYRDYSYKEKISDAGRSCHPGASHFLAWGFLWEMMEQVMGMVGTSDCCDAGKAQDEVAKHFLPAE